MYTDIRRMWMGKRWGGGVGVVSGKVRLVNLLIYLDAQYLERMVRSLRKISLIYVMAVSYLGNYRSTILIYYHVV